MKKIFAICGSTRKNSTNYQVLNHLATLLPGDFEMEIYTSVDQLPHFNPSVQPENLPEAVNNFRQKIQEADGLIICTPEYVFSLPGTLKNGIEWMVSSSAFSGKKTALIVASGIGEKAHESLALIMKTLEADFNENTRLLLQGARSKVTPEGNITNPETVNSLKKLSDSFVTLLRSPSGSE